MATDEIYKSQIEELGNEENDEEKLQTIERDLKDRLREQLNLPHNGYKNNWLPE